MIDATLFNLSRCKSFFLLKTCLLDCSIAAWQIQFKIILFHDNSRCLKTYGIAHACARICANCFRKVKNYSSVQVLSTSYCTCKAWCCFQSLTLHFYLLYFFLLAIVPIFFLLLGKNLFQRLEYLCRLCKIDI